MPRRSRHEEPRPQLNLAPIMNLVVILIPLLLLSVVFLSVGVINVTAPPLSPASSQSSDDEPLRVTVAISQHGFVVSTREGSRPAVDGCDAQGMTICLERRDARPGDVFARLQSMPRSAQDRAIEDIVGAYDFASLYEVLDELKEDHPSETRIFVTASPDVPYALVTRVMDAARFRVVTSGFSSSREFWTAERAKGAELFPDAVVAVAR